MVVSEEVRIGVILQVPLDHTLSLAALDPASSPRKQDDGY